jgi:hypothetical protein
VKPAQEGNAYIMPSAAILPGEAARTHLRLACAVDRTFCGALAAIWSKNVTNSGWRRSRISLVSPPPLANGISRMAMSDMSEYVRREISKAGVRTPRSLFAFQP